MIVIIAPYSPAERSSNPHLGAARKIEAVIDILTQFGMMITLVNTAHECEADAPTTKANVCIAGASITEITPPTYSNRRKGKFLNLFDVDKVADDVLTVGNPMLVWLYNGYAMESRLGVEFRHRSGCHIIQEMEDWHFSRGRGLNPKPFIDWWFWRKASLKATHIFAVNSALANRSRRLNTNVSLFPGVVSVDIAKIRSAHPPFGSEDGIITIGYFGGLSEEKGADHVLSLCDTLPPQYRFIVTGAGPLESAFNKAALGSKGRLQFHGRVNDETLVELIGRCDVMLNPHSPIGNMGNGVFPFKVIEAVASGRMLISTPLPGEDLEDVLQGVCFADHDVSQLREALLGAREWFYAHKSKVDAGATAAVDRFGKANILKVVRKILAEQAT